jgi:hypothetical protein
VHLKVAWVGYLVYLTAKSTILRGPGQTADPQKIEALLQSTQEAGALGLPVENDDSLVPDH